MKFSIVERSVLRIYLAKQRLQLWKGEALLAEYGISTAANGPGELSGSECTPTGAHRIRLKIGAGCPPNTVFVGRRPTGERYSSSLRRQYPHRDWILTRILWLTGLEPGKNRYGAVDTLRRFIYLHGCPDEDPMGVPCSHGCIRMRNADICELFDLVDNGDLVDIIATDSERAARCGTHESPFESGTPDPAESLGGL